MKWIFSLVIVLSSIGCRTSNPSTYKAWSREENENFVYLMYSRPRTNFEKSSESEKNKPLYPVHLVNLKGQIIFRWNAGCMIAHAELLENFEIAVACLDDNPNKSRMPTGVFGNIRRIDKNSDLIHSYVNSNIHHTFYNKSDTFFVLQNRQLTDIEKKKYGLKSAAIVWTDILLQVNEKDEVLWRWDSIDDNQERARLFQNSYSADLTHGNSIVYSDTNPINGSPAVLVSFRNISSVLLIDYKTKKILWASAKNMFSQQHDATFDDDRKILVFDNSVGANDQKSRVVTVDITTNKTEVIYEQGYFSVPKIGAVHKVSASHYLITDSLIGYGFSVDQNRKLLGYIWNTTTHKLKDISNSETDVEGYIFSPIFKIKLFNLKKIKQLSEKP